VPEGKDRLERGFCTKLVARMIGRRIYFVILFFFNLAYKECCAIDNKDY